MNVIIGEWLESELYCTQCDEVVTQWSGPEGFMMMRCQCIEKAGHHQIQPARGWIDRSCRGDRRAILIELMDAEMDSY
jgi:hypothetical protein